MKYTSNLFESIKEALTKKDGGSNGAFKDFLKLEIGKTYLVRLVPNLANPERTIFHYYHHLWNSLLTNELVSTLCPTTYKERCPIDEYRSRIYKTNDKAEIERIKPIKRNENWLVNVYVIKDPTNPENQGQMKILRYGKQLDKIISSAMSGDDAEDFGEKIFDCSERGCNLRIKVEENEGGFPTYVSSRFLPSSPLDDVNPDDLYNAAKSLDTIFEHRSYEEIQKLFNTHFLCQTDEEPRQKSAPKAEVRSEDVDMDGIETYTISNPVAKPSNNEDSDISSRMEDILKDL